MALVAPPPSGLWLCRLDPILGLAQYFGHRLQQLDRDLRLVTQRVNEVEPGHCDAGHIADRPHSRHAGELVEQRHLTERATGSERIDHGFVAAARAAHDLDLAGADREEGDARVTLAQDDVTGLER